MIKISIKDKNGKELSNGDTIKYFVMSSDWQDEYGDNIPNGHYRHKVGVSLKWVEEKYYPDIIEDNYAIISVGRDYGFSDFLDAFDVPDEFFKSSVETEEFGLALDEIRQYTKSTEIEDILEEISGFEIVKTKNE